MPERITVNGRETCLYRTHGPLNLSPGTNRDADTTRELRYTGNDPLTLAGFAAKITRQMTQEAEKQRKDGYKR